AVINQLNAGVASIDVIISWSGIDIVIAAARKDNIVTIVRADVIAEIIIGRSIETDGIVSRASREVVNQLEVVRFGAITEHEILGRAIRDGDRHGLIGEICADRINARSSEKMIQTVRILYTGAQRTDREIVIAVTAFEPV